MDVTSSEGTRPWTCSECGERLLWRARSVDCPTHGPLATLPAWPSEKDTQ